MDGICFRKKEENVFEYLKNTEGLLIVYGASFWGRMLAEEKRFQIDYFCDKCAESIRDIDGIPVIDSIHMESVVRENGKRAIIIICAGLNKATVVSIYRDLMKCSIEADVFNYFENLSIFKDRKFFFQQAEYALYEHSYNCGYCDTRMTERSVELALAKEYLKKCHGEVVEIGAVTPYYFCDNKIESIIDPTDDHVRVNVKKSMFDCDLRGKDILSISTVEHIGTQDFGMDEAKNVIDAIEKIVGEARRYLITAPLGYNKMLDEWVKENRENPEVSVLRRWINNHWTEIHPDDLCEIKYTPLWACGLVIIKKS